MLERLKIALGIKTDTELAQYLGMPQPTLANQKRRGGIDYELIFSKANGINLHWLLTGEGTMYANNAAGKALQEKNNPETFDENTIADMSVVGINRVRQTSETILPEQLSEIENDIKQVLLKIQSMMK